MTTKKRTTKAKKKKVVKKSARTEQLNSTNSKKTAANKASKKKASNKKPTKTPGLMDRLQSQVSNLADVAKGSVPKLSLLQSMFGDGQTNSIYLNPLDPKRVKAMAEAGEFLKEAREIAGFTVSEFASAMNMSEEKAQAIEDGEAAIPLEGIFRAASLLARNDPLPIILKFMRTFSPSVEGAMQKLGVDAIPKHLERERSFINVYRRNDSLRQLSDSEFERLLDYLDSAMNLVLDVMQQEKKQFQDKNKP